MNMMRYESDVAHLIYIKYKIHMTSYQFSRDSSGHSARNIFRSKLFLVVAVQGFPTNEVDIERLIVLVNKGTSRYVACTRILN